MFAEARLTELVESLREQLEDRPAGVSEYHLLTQMRERLPALFPRLEGGDLLGLYRSHFILFHGLYRLRDVLRGAGEAELEIGALRIQLLPYRPGRPGVVAEEPLRAYYLDPGHLERATEEEVRMLLEGFLSRVVRGGQRAEALAELGLADPVEPQEIKTHYRRLVMRHHPDRGGDSERLKRINRAMDQLCRG